jgi:hypothetical protein
VKAAERAAAEQAAAGARARRAPDRPDTEDPVPSGPPPADPPLTTPDVPEIGDLPDLTTLFDARDRRRIQLACGLPTQAPSSAVSFPLLRWDGTRRTGLSGIPMRALGGTPTALQAVDRIYLGWAMEPDGSVHWGDVPVGAVVPTRYAVNQRPSTAEREDVFATLVPAWVTDRDASGAPSFERRFERRELQPKSPWGLFWSTEDGYLIDAMKLALQMLYTGVSSLESGVLSPANAPHSFANVVVDPCGYGSSAIVRSWLLDGRWSLEWREFGERASSTDIRLEIADTGAPFIVRTPPSIPGQAAWAYSNRVRVGANIIAEAAIADYLLWWAWRLLRYVRCRAIALGLADRDYVIPDVPGVAARRQDFGEWPDWLGYMAQLPRRARPLAWDYAVAKLCARLALGAVATMAGLIAHEMGHISGSSPRGWKSGETPHHCRGRDGANCCADFVDVATVHTALARYGLPKPPTPSVAVGAPQRFWSGTAATRLHTGDWRSGVWEPRPTVATQPGPGPGTWWNWSFSSEYFGLSTDPVGVHCIDGGGRFNVVHRGLLMPHHAMRLTAKFPSACGREASSHLFGYEVSDISIIPSNPDAPRFGLLSFDWFVTP